MFSCTIQVTDQPAVAAQVEIAPGPLEAAESRPPNAAEGVEVIFANCKPVESGEEHPYRVDCPLEKWTSAMERKFQSLIRLKALGKASQEDLQELDSLKIDRRQLKNPLTSDQLLHQYRKLKKEEELLKLISEYVEICRPKNSQTKQA